ncbi:MAG: hypothetical protein NTU80_10580 [Verrucomicrobia bacterium]|nr:hypothetical protein [Verrucomicrobiota bacterium]
MRNTDPRFKELVNLYLDHRLNPGEALELEMLLQAEPARRRELAMYRAMQGGCEELFRRSVAGAPASQRMLRALREADRKVNAPERSRGWAWNWNWAAGGGLAGAAALFTVLMVRVSPPVMSVTADAPETTLASVAQAEPEPVILAKVAEFPAARPSGMSSLVPERGLAPRLTLAAVGIANESHEVGAVSRWSYVLDEATVQEAERAAAWARGENRPAWSVDATTVARYGASPSASLGVAGSEFQTTAASFTFGR